MSKQDLQLLNIEVGTFKRADNQLTLDMERKLFRYDRISELNELCLARFAAPSCWSAISSLRFCSSS